MSARIINGRQAPAHGHGRTPKPTPTRDALIRLSRSFQAQTGAVTAIPLPEPNIVAASETVMIVAAATAAPAGPQRPDLDAARALAAKVLRKSPERAALDMAAAAYGIRRAADLKAAVWRRGLRFPRAVAAWLMIESGGSIRLASASLAIEREMIRRDRVMIEAAISDDAAFGSDMRELADLTRRYAGPHGGDPR